MKIYFCDICNQSIPLKDLDEGLAVAVKGKIICAACNAAAAAATTKNAAAPAVGASRARGSLGRDAALLVVAAALGAGAGWWMLEKRATALETRLASQSNEMTSRSGEQTGKLSTISGDLDELRRGIEGLGKRFDAAALEGAARREHDQADLEARIETIKKYMRELEALKERVLEIEVRSAASADATSQLQREVSGARSQIADLAAAVGKLGTAGPASQPANPGESPGAPVTHQNPLLPPLSKDLQDIAKNLKSSEPGVRYDAVEQLGKSRDARVIPYISQSLDDPDEFVRRVAIEVLGDLNAKTAIPLLIDALMDNQLHVRQAVIAALRKITGQNIKYDEYAKKEDRQKQQRLWKTWWDQNQEKILQN